MKAEEAAALERRVDRLEHALTALARSHTANYPLRAHGPGVDALHELEAEIAEFDGRAAETARRSVLEAELTSLGGTH
jgi:hypothetical protein